MTDAGLFSLFSLLYEGHKVLYKQLLAWILQGSLFDPYDEFFIVPDGSSNNPSDQAPMATSSLSSSSAQVIEKFLLATLTYVIFTYGVAIRSISCFSVLFVVVHVHVVVVP